MTLCAYCGLNEATTEDHIPPKAIFPNPLAAHLLRVPACATCHGGTSDDDEYFRDSLVKQFRVAESPLAQEQLGKMFRAAAKPEKRRYLQRVVESFDTARIVTPAGIELGTAPVVHVDAERVRAVLKRVVRGLHYIETGVPLSKDIRLQVAVEANNPEPLVKAFYSTQPERGRVIESGVFGTMWFVRKTTKMWPLGSWFSSTRLWLLLSRRPRRATNGPRRSSRVILRMKGGPRVPEAGGR